jgi:hypothetical protein
MSKRLMSKRLSAFLAGAILAGASAVVMPTANAQATALPALTSPLTAAATKQLAGGDRERVVLELDEDAECRRRICPLRCEVS